jgi:DNA-directed RNA polymerase specialized sigma24 family protein
MASRLDPRFREVVYQQIWEAALAVARNQQPDIAAHAEDIAMSVVERFAGRQMTAQVSNPAAWGAVQARYACINFANRQLARARREAGGEALGEEHREIDPSMHPYGAVAGADAIEFAPACLSDREREIVRLVDDGYSHDQIARELGYAGPRSVTTTLSRIRGKILAHVGGREALEELLAGSGDEVPQLWHHAGSLTRQETRRPWA